MSLTVTEIVRHVFHHDYSNITGNRSNPLKGKDPLPSSE